jgi:hypothetical protein
LGRETVKLTGEACDDTINTANKDNGYRVSFPGVKRPGRGVDHPPLSSARVKERVELYLYSPSGSSWPVLGRTLPLIYVTVKTRYLYFT